ncbi:MAG: hypothetical protein ACRC9P_08280 [Bacteroides sp.]
MELEEYIIKVVTSINDAIDTLNENTSIIVNPTSASFYGSVSKMVHKNKEGITSIINEVEFDLSISEVKKRDKSGGVKIKVLDASLINETNKSQSNRVRFTIPVVFSSKG